MNVCYKKRNVRKEIRAFYFIQSMLQQKSQLWPILSDSFLIKYLGFLKQSIDKPNFYFCSKELNHRTKGWRGSLRENCQVSITGVAESHIFIPQARLDRIWTRGPALSCCLMTLSKRLDGKKCIYLDGKKFNSSSKLYFLNKFFNLSSKWM